MTATTPAVPNTQLLAALDAWRQSVERVLHVASRVIDGGPAVISLSDRDEFVASLRALYELEALIFDPAAPPVQEAVALA